ncbi:MAG: N-acetylmuramidase domain-containing protein, partial [Hyphomonadaceae bacterium]|nr:N-acetylmuramidase domain-containing protein [Hyphomonadaceae bacterium]
VYGKNWLIPLSANIAKPEDLPLETIPLDTVLTAMGGATTKVLILDACRNNPFERAIRLGAGAPVRSNNQGAGLAPINQAALPNGMLVMYATEPGATASDGLPTDSNSPFARALVAELPTRGVDVRLVAGGVTERTMELTQQAQRPFVTALLGRAPVYIAGETTPPTTPVTPPPVVSRPVAQTGADAQRMLVRAKAAGDAGDCQALLDLVALLPPGDAATQAQTAAQQCRATYLDRLTTPNAPIATQAELAQLAAQYNLEPATLLAVGQVESGPLGGYDANGRPIITFEPHLFSRQTQRRYDVSHPAISSPRWNPALYSRTQDGRWEQLRAAFALDPEAAVSATSWGKFQILGRNFAAVGYGSATEFVAAMAKSEIAQYRSLIAFAISQSLLDDLQRLDFRGFAGGYNGMGQVDRYSRLLRDAYVRNGGDPAKLPVLTPPTRTHTPAPSPSPTPATPTPSNGIIIPDGGEPAAPSPLPLLALALALLGIGVWSRRRAV